MIGIWHEEMFKKIHVQRDFSFNIKSKTRKKRKKKTKDRKIASATSFLQRFYWLKEKNIRSDWFCWKSSRQMEIFSLLLRSRQVAKGEKTNWNLNWAWALIWALLFVLNLKWAIRLSLCHTIEMLTRRHLHQRTRSTEILKMSNEKSMC